MPELPEVETVRKTLKELVTGKEIDHISVYWPKIIKKPVEVEEFTDALKGQVIDDIGRRGKFLLFYTNDFTLVSHLRMEGKYGVFPEGEPLDKHTHVIFHFTDGMEMRYKDVRKFGTMHLFLRGEEFKSEPLDKLGPEPFSDEFTPDYLKNKFTKTERKIKAVLLDQTILTGLGNIYVDEALFRAGIHPERKAKSLSEEEIGLIAKEAAATLSEAVKQGGSTIRSYINSQGQIGMFQLQLFVYGRNGEACRKCGTVIEKRVSAGRGTHYCPKCQKET
ncbi:DNA-formamidopyrimidine glycosylase [Heyndrickxia acidicola]|uniref:Formamidopyrimidine-DNA glycosylase n=1 Tax=Heyndrickxia acidicola TaxID=209389 RepID=A0ABU6MJ09_9BACI|nr:DNA-formamidopyrimidine glycosylase [Heyndrickxia acidicola]MED1203222.1 DNA-formamidopyrimidine glycosylase [Heyndrickxia acidicola]